MTATIPLTPVIQIDEEKCCNCYACITACPVKYCIDGSGEKVMLNHDLCIGCGNCITVCSHQARLYIDDINNFFENIKRGEKMIAIAAPAIASFFSDEYLRLNGYLKSIGIEAVFDVSLGAELTVLSYVNYIKEEDPRLVIAQPCPAIVTFLEIYQPKLLPFLAPADSPMLHIIKMIHEYYPQYKNHKIMVISPCIAKRREFDETRLGDYNVTMLALKKHLQEHNIDLSAFPEIEYEGINAERAVQFSSPGGLLDTAERFIPGIRRRTRKIEGTHAIYPYLEEAAEAIDKPGITFPLLVDCLNCEKGCNGGPGTGNEKKSMDELESPVLKRSAELEKRFNPKKLDRLYKKYHKMLSQYWKPNLYKRTYRDLSGNLTLKYPNEAELEQVFRKMRKYSSEDLYDCTSCGYGTCRAMATAVFNNLNKPENCAHYNLSLLEEEHSHIVGLNKKLKDHITVALELIGGINNVVDNLNKEVSSQQDAVNQCSSVTETIISSLKSTSELSRNKKEAMNELIENASQGQTSMSETITSVQSISQSIDGIASAIKIISTIAANTNLLSMNAAIEAAHAGDAGRGFAVVADEIRRLSESTRQNSRNISQTLSNIISGINTTSKCSNDTNNLINNISEEIHSFTDTMTDFINTLTQLSVDSSEITKAMDSLREHSSAVKSGYSEMLSMTDKLREDMIDLSKVSNEELKNLKNGVQ
ncbi:MAG: methyl-accepting chemotaxis protein [Treponema sp.]|nr:methyl-accepting chemotaxis protein [Treponema sp.]